MDGTDSTLDGSIQARVSRAEDSSFVAEQYADEEVSSLIAYLEHRKLPKEDSTVRRVVAESQMYEILDGALYHVQSDKTLRLYMPETRQRALFDETHSGVYASHQRTAKIHATLSKHYWWPRMRRDIEKWCKECIVCWERRAGNPTKVPLTPIPVGGPFDRVGVDILQMPKSGRRHQYVVVFIDYLTKWVEVYPTRDHTALTLARMLVEKFIPVHGVPREILSDRGANFLSKLMTEVYRLIGTNKISTTAYHPQTDGLTERFHRTLLDMLAKTAKKNIKDWDLHLPYVLFSYRVAQQESTKASPFELLYGRDAKLPNDLMEPPGDEDCPTPEGYLTEVRIRMSEAWTTARDSIRKAQKKQKSQYDQRAVPLKFKEGDLVYLFQPGTLPDNGCWRNVCQD